MKLLLKTSLSHLNTIFVSKLRGMKQSNGPWFSMGFSIPWSQKSQWLLQKWKIFQQNMWAGYMAWCGKPSCVKPPLLLITWTFSLTLFSCTCSILLTSYHFCGLLTLSAAFFFFLPIVGHTPQFYGFINSIPVVKIILSGTFMRK